MMSMASMSSPLTVMVSRPLDMPSTSTVTTLSVPASPLMVMSSVSPRLNSSSDQSSSLLTSTSTLAEPPSSVMLPMVVSDIYPSVRSTSAKPPAVNVRSPTVMAVSSLSSSSKVARLSSPMAVRVTLPMVTEASELPASLSLSYTYTVTSPAELVAVRLSISTTLS